MAVEIQEKDGAANRPHARVLQPSAAKRWGLCHMSPLLSKGLPSVSGEFAELGTMAHRYAEMQLRRRFADCTGELCDRSSAEEHRLQVNLPDEFRGYVREYVAKVVEDFRGESRLGELSFIAFEQRLPVDFITGEDGARGTADLLAVTIDKDGATTLHVVDFKTGRTRVVAEKNEQLFIYGAASIRRLPEIDPFLPTIDRVRLSIVQPSVEDGFTSWELPAAAFADDSKAVVAVREAAARCLDLYNGAAEPTDDDFPISIPEHWLANFCKYCPALYKCPYFKAKVSEGISVAGDGVLTLAVQRRIPLPETPQQLSKAYGYLPIIEAWCEEVKKHALESLLAGDPVPGWKVVEGRAGIRKWSDDGAAAKELKGSLKVGELYETKLISPTKAEKLHKEGRITDRKWAKVSNLITRSAPKPTVVPESDPRPSLTEAITNEFQDLGNADS